MLPPALELHFEQCRRGLSPGARSDLELLAVKLNRFKGPNVVVGDYLASITKALGLTTALSSEECKALSLLRSVRAMRRANRYGSSPLKRYGNGYQRWVDAGNAEHAGDADEFQYAVSPTPKHLAERQSPIHHGK
jgi:hypothetical protein